MADPFYELSPNSPATHVALVTPDDGTDLDPPARSLLLGTGGDIKITTTGGETVTLTNVPAGILPIFVTRVWETETTASDIAALW